LGLREETCQASLKLAQEGKEGVEAYTRELERAHVDQLAQLTSYQVQSIGLQEAALASEMQRKKLEELDTAWRQKLAEREDTLWVKVEALGLLQAEANKLRVEKEFLEKQVVSKDSRIVELEREVQELTGRWRAHLTRASKRLWLRRLVRTRESMFQTAIPPTMSSTEKSCLSNWMTEPPTLSCHLYFCDFLFVLDNL